jgi:beta-N-acetylhexosaminidase
MVTGSAQAQSTQAAFITGVTGQVLTADERRFLASTRPCGLILFARNIDTPDQVRRLIADALAAIGAPALVLIDQEGGRVQRLRPPHWRTLPSGAMYASRYALDTTQDKSAAVHETRSISRLIAHDLRDLGITCNCTPVLDVLAPDAHANIGNRSLGTAPESVIALGRAIAEGHMAGGVLPVIKHIPGHGRATLDTHLALPTVTTSEADLATTDFAPFKALAHLPAAMTAHVVFSAIDPTGPASTSKHITDRIIRGHMGFQGLLMSDDLSMHALAGTLASRAAAVIAAGTDVALHCNGQMAEMEQVASHVPRLQGPAKQRFERALTVTKSIIPFDKAEAEACLAHVLSVAAIS